MDNIVQYLKTEELLALPVCCPTHLPLASAAVPAEVLLSMQFKVRDERELL